MEQYIQVEGNPSLVRDAGSRAIINTNVSEYETHIRNREIALSKLSQADRNTEDINILKQDMSEIKQMLQLLIKSKED
jgi:hypothetical protein